jgi:hypothetical protein
MSTRSSLSDFCTVSDPRKGMPGDHKSGRHEASTVPFEKDSLSRRNSEVATVSKRSAVKSSIRKNELLEDMPVTGFQGQAKTIVFRPDSGQCLCVCVCVVSLGGGGTYCTLQVKADHRCRPPKVLCGPLCQRTASATPGSGFALRTIGLLEEACESHVHAQQHVSERCNRTFQPNARRNFSQTPRMPILQSTWSALGTTIGSSDSP